MPIPFPGMNPYMEHPDLWPNIHQKMIAALANQLETQLPASYKVRLRERHYRVSGEDSLVVGSPGLDWGADRADGLDHPEMPFVRDRHPGSHPGSHPDPNAHHAISQLESNLNSHPTDAQKNPEISASLRINQPISVLIPVPQKIYETYLEIINLTGDIVTVIEALSPKKKRPGRGRTLYERHRETIFGSPIHFVEIDLLRGWEPSSIYGPDEAGDYRILISRSEQRPRAELYTWTVTEPIPPVVLPLSGHEGLLFCLKSVVDQACDRTDLLVNYQQDPLPPLHHRANIWLEDFLQKVGMRPCAS